jgi:hypothetical protein
MKFKAFYGVFVIAAVAINLMDYGISLWGFYHFSPALESNTYVRLLMLWLSPYLALSALFLITLFIILISYGLLAGYMKTLPYSGGMRDVWKHLYHDASVTGRDLSIFACLALYIIFILMHLGGFLSWLTYLT